MPLYEYRCKGCGHMFEVLQKFSDRTLRTCKLCHGRLEKLISRTSFQLKGGGWDSEGYSKNGSKKPKSGEPASKTKKPKKSEKSEQSDGSSSSKSAAAR